MGDSERVKNGLRRSVIGVSKNVRLPLAYLIFLKTIFESSAVARGISAAHVAHGPIPGANGAFHSSCELVQEEHELLPYAFSASFISWRNRLSGYPEKWMIDADHFVSFILCILLFFFSNYLNLLLFPSRIERSKSVDKWICGQKPQWPECLCEQSS